MTEATRKVRVRIAPSPTGDPHIGTAYMALFNKVFALQHGGTYLLRIEDTDRTRYSASAIDLLMASLRWLDLVPDEGPGLGGRFGPYVQSERLAIYQEYSQKLINTGHAYPCFCTPERLAKMREEQQARKEPARYDRHCLYLPASEVRDLLAARTPHTVRLKMPDDGEATFTDMIRGTVTFRYELMDDQILMKSDGFPTYQLAAIVDDHLMEITHVIRGEEWISSVPKHLALFAAFGWQVPQYAHLPLLRNRDRSKMSKRKNPTSILWYREQGYLPDALVNFMGLMGWSHPDGREVFDRGEMVKHLRLEQISLGGPIFDFQKLDWMNGVYIRKLTTQELSRLCRPYLPQHLTDEQIEVVLPLVHERLKRLSEVSDFTSFFWPEHLDYDPTLLQVKGQSPEDVRGALENVLSALEDYQYPDHTTWEAALRSIAARRGMKDGDLFMLVRVAVTGRVASPPLYETSVALGWPLTRQRIKEALAKIP